MLKKIITSIISLLPLLQAQATENWIEGAIYSTKNDGGYTVIKILKVDPNGVHVRMYSNLYPTKPKSIDESKLFISGMDRDEGTPLGMGHAPISHTSFSTWGAEFIQDSKILADELEGYHIWLEANGGYF